MSAAQCGKGLYFDQVIRECVSCSELCDELTPTYEGKKLDCEARCPDYHRNDTLSHSALDAHGLQFSNASSQTSSIFIVMIVGTCVILVLLAVLLVFLVRKIHSRSKSKGVDSEPFINTKRDGTTTDGALSSSDVICPTQHLSSATQRTPVPSSSNITVNGSCQVVINARTSVSLGSAFNVTPVSDVCDAACSTIVNMSPESTTNNVLEQSSSLHLRADCSSSHVAYDLPPAASASNESEQSSMLHLISTEFEGRMKMFGWLNSQPWVTQYFEGPDGVQIAVENIDQDQAREEIRRAASEFVSEFDFRIIQPIGGNYIPCPVTSPGAMSMPQKFCQHFPATNQFCLCPGVQLYSPRMEPEDDKHVAESGYAMYAGCIRGSWFGKYGLTVGHLFDSVGIECQRRAAAWFPVSMTVGKCALKVNCVDLVKSIRRTTADLALIQLTCPAQNAIHLNGRNYRLRLYRGKLDFRRIRSVAIVTKDGDVRYGRVNNFLFTIDKVGLYNTMSIVDIECQSVRLNDSGDSGALVTSIPGQADEIFVYGMVIGYYESQDGTSSNTVATRLWDVLECLVSQPEHSLDIDFADLHIEDLQIDYVPMAVETCSEPIPSETEEMAMDTLESGYVT